MNTLVRQLVLVCVMCFSFNVFAESITVDKGHVREVIPGNRITSAYMEIHNGFGHEVSLLRATSTASPKVEIHTHLMADGMMKMRQVESINIAGKQTVTLQPMGFHLMMFDLPKTLKAGQQVELTLYFSNDHQVTVLLPVQSIKQKKQRHHHH